MNFNFDIGLIDTLQTLDCSVAPPVGGTAGVLSIIGTGALLINAGSTAERPSGVAGMVRFNNDTTLVEYFDGSSWNPLSTSSSTVSSVAAVSNTSALSISGSPITSAGTFTFDLSSSLNALDSLGSSGSNGFLVKTSTDTFSSRSIAGTAGNISVTNGNGVSGNPTIDLVDAGTPVTSQFVKITTDSKGRVTSTSAVGSSDITTALGYTPVNKAGDTGVGSLSMASNADITLNGGTVTGLPTPSNATDAVNKSYVDGLSAGVTAKQAVRVATTADLSATSAGSGVGKTLTANANGALVIDGVTVSANDRVLVKDQTSAQDNGVYVVTATGDGSNPFVLTRATDFDGTPAGEVAAGDFVFVQDGTTFGDTGWVIYVAGNAAINLDTDAVNWTQFTGTGAVSLSFAGDSGTPDVLVSGNTLNIVGTANQVSTFANGSNNITISLPQDIATTSTPEFASVVLNGLAVDSLVVTNGSGQLDALTLTNGQLLIGSTGAAPVAAALTAGTGISVTNGAGSITIDNTGVTSFSGGVTGLTPNSATTGAVTLGGILTIAHGGTGQTTAAAAFTALAPAAASYGAVLAWNATSGQWVTVTPSFPTDAGKVLTANSGAQAGVSWNTPNAGTVTSVALAAPSSVFSVSGSPVTSSGTLTLTLASQTANTVFAAPDGSGGTPSFRALSYADLPIQLYAENASSPSAPSAVGANAVALGSGSIATADGSTAIGYGSNATVFGGVVQANGAFASNGDAQAGTYVMRNVTTNNTATELFLDGTAATQRLIFANNSVVTFNILVAARRTDATGGGGGYSFLGVVRKDGTAASNTIIGAVSKTVIGETNVAWDANVTADTTTGALTVTVTGENAKSIRWVATVRTTEVTN